MAKLLLLNGPNLNLLGTREPHLYGHTTLDTIVTKLVTSAKKHGHELEHVQSNAEHVLIDHIQRARQENVAFILINAGAYTHTSIALRDALVTTGIRFIEIHVSNIYAREPFRHHSYLEDVAVGVIAGFGVHSYELALQAAMQILEA